MSKTQIPVLIEIIPTDIENISYSIVYNFNSDNKREIKGNLPIDQSKNPKVGQYFLITIPELKIDNLKLTFNNTVKDIKISNFNVLSKNIFSKKYREKISLNKIQIINEDRTNIIEGQYHSNLKDTTLPSITVNKSFNKLYMMSSYNKSLILYIIILSFFFSLICYKIKNNNKGNLFYRKLLDDLPLVILFLILFFSTQEYLVLSIYSGDCGKFLGTNSIIDSIYHIVLSASPYIGLYFILRLLRASSLFSFVLLTGLYFSLTIADLNKRSLTNASLVISDLTDYSCIETAIGYISILDWIIMLIYLLICVIVFRFGFSSKKNHFSNLFINISLILIFCIPSIYAIYQVPTDDDSKSIKNIKQNINHFLDGIGLEYEEFIFRGSISHTHGVIFNIIASARPVKLPKLNSDDYLLYKKIKEISPQDNIQTRPRTVAIILCESCYFDDNHFKNKFKSLFNIGFKSFRAISPVYGGGTCNSEFEVLTGLPVNTPYLSLNVFPKYAVTFSKLTDVIPNGFKQSDYTTYVNQPTSKTFFHTDIVYPKLGFDFYDSTNENLNNILKLNLSLNSLVLMNNLSLKEANSIFNNGNDAVAFASSKYFISNHKNEKLFIYNLTMTTHGAYGNSIKNELGNYPLKLDYEVKCLSDYVNFILNHDKNALIVIFGDHKPALNDFFKTENIIKNQNAKQWELGDVPVLIYSNNTSAVDSFIEEANHKPLYCMTSYLDKYFYKFGLPNTKFVRASICDNVNYKKDNYEELSKRIPFWLYYYSLFDNN